MPPHSHTSNQHTSDPQPTQARTMDGVAVRSPPLPTGPANQRQENTTTVTNSILRATPSPSLDSGVRDHCTSGSESTEPETRSSTQAGTRATTATPATATELSGYVCIDTITRGRHAVLTSGDSGVNLNRSSQGPQLGQYSALSLAATTSGFSADSLLETISSPPAPPAHDHNSLTATEIVEWRAVEVSEAEALASLSRRGSPLVLGVCVCFCTLFMIFLQWPDLIVEFVQTNSLPLNGRQNTGSVSIFQPPAGDDTDLVW